MWRFWSSAGAEQLSDCDPLGGGWSRPENHHWGSAGGHARSRRWAEAGVRHHPQRILLSNTAGLQRSHAHAAVRPHAAHERPQPWGAQPELGHHQLHHKGKRCFHPCTSAELLKVLVFTGYYHLFHVIQSQATSKLVFYDPWSASKVEMF